MADPANTTEILLRISADVEAMKGLQAQFLALQENAKKSAQEVNSLGAKLQEMSTEGALAIGAAFSAGALGVQAIADKMQEAVSGTTNLVEQMRRVTQATDLSNDAIQVLSKGARISFDDLTMKVQKFRAELGAALLDPSGGQAKLFTDKLGLSPDQFRGKEVEEQLELVAEGISRLNDKNEKAAVVLQLFGRNAGLMIPFLEKLRVEGYGKLREEVEKTAGILGTDMAQAIDRANLGAEEAMNKLSIGLAPVNLRLAEFKRSLTEATAAHASFIGELGTALAYSSIAVSLGGALQGVNWASLGSKFGLTFGAAFAVVVGGLLIEALKDASLKAIEEQDKKLSVLGQADKIGEKIRLAANPKEAKDALDQAKTLRDETLKRFEELNRRFIFVNSLGGNLIPEQQQERLQLIQTLGLLDTILAKQKGVAEEKAKEREASANLVVDQEKANTQAQDYVAATKEGAAEAQRRNILAQAADGTDQEKIAALDKVIELSRQEYQKKLDLVNLLTDEKTKTEYVAAVKQKEGEVENVYLQAKAAINKKIIDDSDRDRARAYTAAAEQERREEQSQVNAVKSDQFMTEIEKKAALLVIYKQEEQRIDEEIRAADLKAATAGADTAGKTAAEQQAKLLRDRKANLPYEIRNSSPNSVGDDLQAGIKGLKDGFTNVGQALTSVIGGAINGISAGITGLINRTMDWKQASLSVLQGIAQATVQSFSQITAQWIVQHAVMDNVRKLFHTKGTAEQTAATTAETTIHTGGEVAKTEATAAGAESRGIIRIGETIVHGIQVAWQVATHVAGEIAKTAATLAQGAIRIGSIIIESLANVFKAGVEALSSLSSIPIVGPFLGVAAMASVIALGIGVVGKIKNGFADGGFTGGNDRDRPAGIVHEGEWVAPQWMVSDPRYARQIAELEAARGGKGLKTGGFWGSFVSSFLDPLHPDRMLKSQLNTALHPPGQGKLMESIYGGGVGSGTVYDSRTAAQKAGGVDLPYVAGGSYPLSGGLGGGSASALASPSVSGGGGTILIANFDRRQDAESWLQSQNGRRIMTDFVRGAQSEL